MTEIANLLKWSGYSRYGPVAQLGERHNGIVEVTGSSPVGSRFKFWREKIFCPTFRYKHLCFRGRYPVTVGNEKTLQSNNIIYIQKNQDMPRASAKKYQGLDFFTLYFNSDVSNHLFCLIVQYYDIKTIMTGKMM